MRMVPVLLAVIALAAAACTGGPAASCDELAIDYGRAVEDFLDRLEDVTPDEVAAAGESWVPAGYAAFEEEIERIDEGASSQDCSDGLFLDELDDLEGRGEVAALFLVELRAAFNGG